MTDAFSVSAPLDRMIDKPLSGLSILVTRPVHQAASLIQLLQQQGAAVLHQPAIAIEATSNDTQSQIIGSLEQYNWIIFISKNSVEYGLKLISNSTHIAKSQAIAAIGKATRQALSLYGFTDITSPDSGYDSEALLESSAFSAPQIKARKVLIIRGGQGREYLKEGLESRGANVTYLDVYRRQPAKLILTPADFAKLDIITVSSQQGLEYLVSILDKQTLNHIHDKLLITPAERCSQKARELGFKQVEAAANATDNAMLKRIIDNVSTSRNNNGQKL